MLCALLSQSKGGGANKGGGGKPTKANWQDAFRKKGNIAWFCIYLLTHVRFCQTSVSTT